MRGGRGRPTEEEEVVVVVAAAAAAAENSLVHVAGILGELSGAIGILAAPSLWRPLRAEALFTDSCKKLNS